MFTQVEDLLPVISFESKKDSDTQTKHNEFVKRMLARGLHVASGSPAGRMVYAHQQGWVGVMVRGSPSASSGSHLTMTNLGVILRWPRSGPRRMMP